MIRTIICYDNNDDELGDYFELSYADLVNGIKNENVSVKPMSGLDCSEDEVINAVDAFDEKPFVFVGLSHGNESQLLTNNEVFVDEDNLGHFEKALFYSPACDTALSLGDQLVSSGCYSFIGCTDVTLATYEEYNSTYIECENYCLKEFLNTDKSISVCFDEMIALYDRQIGLLSIENDEILVAMELTGNRDSFTLKGNTGLTRNDLNLE